MPHVNNLNFPEYTFVGVTPQIVRSIQSVLESIQYAEAWYAVFSI